MKNFKEKANLIWDVANLLRGDYKQSDYGKVILPMTVLRRLDCVLEPTREKVMNFLPRVEHMSEAARDTALNKVAGLDFHNRSNYNFDKLIADPNDIAQNLKTYINGFSSSAREILEYFSFDTQIDRMDNPETDILFQVVKSFQEIDLTPDRNNLDQDSMEMGYIFEELIRKFSEQSNETAGEHFSPREVIRLMVHLLFLFDNDILTIAGIVKTLYDAACGTGGMLSVGEQYVKEHNPKADLKVFGQEINPESYAICKSDMLIKGQNPSNIKFGDTFISDGFKNETFDYMLSNPPFGVNWKKSQKFIQSEADNRGMDGRFGAGLPRINDGSLLFLQHMISKMKGDGSRIAIIFNGSPLFTGSADGGESNIRKWIIENDWLEGIIALPDQLFYNTGISTYIWIVTNKKSAQRKGKVQLINATGDVKTNGDAPTDLFWQKMDRSLGNKRKKITENGNEKGIGFITQLYGNFEENEYCKILPNEYFAYWRITVEQPLMNKGKVVKLKGAPKPDTALRDYENIPFLKEDRDGKLFPQTIEEYFDAEVKPHLPTAWIDHSKTKVGYEINFTKYFYQFKPLRPLSEIKADILDLERKTSEPLI